MEQGVRELIGLLKAFVDEAPLSNEAMTQLDAALPQVLYYAKLHNVMGIWAYKVQEYYVQNPPDNEEELEVWDAAKEIYARDCQKSSVRIEKYQELSQKLHESGIDHLIFKGIVVKDYYPNSQLRTFGDIDFVIRQEDRMRCHALMQKLDYQVIIDYEPVYTYRREQEIYEVHTAIMSENFTDRADYVDYFKEIWNRATLKENHVWTFSPEFHFVYMLSHIGKHIYGSGAGIRMYLDLALYIKCLGKSMDWDVVLEELKKLELTQFFYLTLFSLRHWFGTMPPVPVPEPEEMLFEEFCDFTMESGVFGIEGRDPIKQSVFRQNGESGLRRKTILKDFFPPVGAIKNRYRYLRKYSWLLPVAWLQRSVCNLKKLGKKIKEIKNIVIMKKKEIQEVKNFYRRIGL